MRPGALAAVAAFLVIVTLGSYRGVFDAGFVWDDLLFFQEGHRLPGTISFRSLGEAFSSFSSANWHPLTVISHILALQLFGPEPGAHHLVNLGIHTLAAVVLLLALVQLTGSLWPAALTAALFAVHPLHVESVAWVSERKDVLSALFWFLAMIAYGRYARRPSVISYLAVAVALALGLMSKPTVVTLPVVFLLLDVWPLARCGPGAGSRECRPAVRRFGLLVLEKVPLVALSAATAFLTMQAQGAWGATSALSLPLWVRLENAAVSVVRYLAKAVWPTSLSYFYPHPGSFPSVWPAIGAVGLLLALFAPGAVAWRRFPMLLTGWSWFLVTIFPMIGIIQAGQQAMADRYTYLPLVGLFMAVSWCLSGAIAGRRGMGATAIGAGILVIATLGVLTARQVTVWRDEETLYRHALEVDPGNWHAHLSLGRVLRARGALDEAAVHLREAGRANSSATEALVLLGATLADQERYDEARLTCERAAETDAGRAGVCFYVLGNALVGGGRRSEAVGAFRRATELAPGDPETWNNLGCVLFEVGRTGESVAALRRALSVKPGHPGARANLGRVLGAASAASAPHSDRP